MILETRDQLWPDEAACAASGAALAACSGLGDAFIELHGPLGAGKTTFVRHLLRALGFLGRVKSPTYTVLESYEVVGLRPQAQPPEPRTGGGGAGLQVHHFDFYRFDDPREGEDAGFREVFAGPGLKLAEWPDKAAGLLPVADLRIVIDPGDGQGDGDGNGDGDAEDQGQAEVKTQPRHVRFVAGSALGMALLPALPAAILLP